MLLVTGSIIGAGVFFTPNDVAQVVQSPGAMIAVWLIGGLIALTGSLTYAELGGLFPQAGGVYVFLREAYGGLPAFLYGWVVMLVIAPGALALVAGFFAANLCLLLPMIPPAAEIWIGVGVILLLTLVNIRGVKLGSRVQNAFTLAKLLAIALLVAGGLLYQGEPAPAEVLADVPVPHPASWAILLAMMPVLFSYGGWQNGTYVAAEVKRPQRDVPFAVILGTLIVIASYVLVNAAYLRVLTPEAIGSSRTFAARAAELALGPAGGLLVTLGILVSTFGICAAILLTNPRVTQAVGEDGLFFAGFGRLHETYRTPHWSIAVLGIWGGRATGDRQGGAVARCRGLRRLGVFCRDGRDVVRVSPNPRRRRTVLSMRVVSCGPDGVPGAGRGCSHRNLRQIGYDKSNPGPGHLVAGRAGILLVSE